jgi:hypothetical protein
MYIPDNLDIYEYSEHEQERINRLRKRIQREYEKEEYEWLPCTNSQDSTENY